MPRSLDRAEDEKCSLEDGLAQEAAARRLPRPSNLHDVGFLGLRDFRGVRGNGE